MNDSRLVSVIMPTYNGSKFLAGAIDSILSQTYKNFEFIIVDDGSTDNTSELIKSFKDDRIKYIFQENKGPVYAYNTGFRNSIGEFIFIMDHDDYSYPQRIEKQLGFIIEKDLDICGSKYEIIHERNGYIEKINRVYSNEELHETLLFLPWALCTPTICMKRKLFEQYGYFDESYKVSFDYEFISRILFKVKMGIVPECLFRWRHNPLSYSSRTSVLGRKVFTAIAFREITERKNYLSKYKYNLYLGLLHYYSDQLVVSSLFLLKSAIYKIEKKNIKFLLATMSGGPVIKITRRYYLFGAPVLRSLKKYFLGL